MKLSVRFSIFKRDGFTCQYCGRTPPAVVLEVDHVHPKSKGGTDDADNLLTSCFDCNRGKRDGLLNVAPASVEQKAEMLKERRRQLRAYNKLLEAEATEIEEQIDWTQDVMREYHDAYFTTESRNSVRHFLKHLPPREIADAMHLAMGRFDNANSGFRYFCGICWNKIKGTRR